LLIEPRGVLNTGHEGGERTAKNDVWIRRAPTILLTPEQTLSDAFQCPGLYRFRIPLQEAARYRGEVRPFALAVRRRSSAGNCEDQTGSFRTIGSPVDRRSKIAVQAPNREAKPSGRRGEVSGRNCASSTRSHRRKKSWYG